MASIKIAFWNLQNLFDIEASEIAADLEFTPAEGWDQEALDNKIENLAEVINLLHEGRGPDLLGICEIENRDVADLLLEAIGRSDYRLAHVENPDIRGIDTSLIYSNDVFELVGEPVGHLVHLRYPTRDIFEVNLRVRENDTPMTVFVNHWPSRSRGLYETEPFRLTVASHCGRLVDRVLKFPRDEFLSLPASQASLDKLNERWNRNVLLMGDFNDEPFNRSLLEHLQASGSLDHLEEELKPAAQSNIPSAKKYLGLQAYLFNCMWRLMGISDEGTYHFSRAVKSMNLLDQLIVSRGIFYGLQKLQVDLDSVKVARPGVMTTQAKRRPKKFDKSKKKGYSDHFPIEAVIETVP